VKEIINFIKNITQDYKNGLIDKSVKRSCYFRIIKNIILSLWSVFTSPFIYPVWYLFRKSITNKIYKGTSWQEIDKLMYDSKKDEVKSRLIKNGYLLYLLWTYGDSNDPLGRGGIPNDYRDGKNNFWNRYMFGAFRNPRFNINYLYFRTGPIQSVSPIIDQRNIYSTLVMWIY